MNCNIQKKIKIKITQNTKKIFFYGAIFSCFASSAFAMQSSLKLLEKTAMSMRHFSVVPASNNLSDLSVRSSVLRANLQKFHGEIMHLDVRNAKVASLKKEGRSIFIATTIMPSDTLPTIVEKTNVVETILNAQHLLYFLNKEDVIEACNNSVNNKISGRTEDLSAVVAHVNKLIFSSPPLLQIGYPAVSSSLEILKLRLENSERMKKIISKTKENHTLSLVGQHGWGCGVV